MQKQYERLKAKYEAWPYVSDYCFIDLETLNSLLAAAYRKGKQSVKRKSK